MKWRYSIPALLFLGLGGIFYFTLTKIGRGTLDVREIPSPLIGKAAPHFALPSLLEPSELIDSNVWRGQSYLLNVWGSWCEGCKEEHSTLIALARVAGVPLIGMAWKDDHASARAMLTELGNPYSVVVADDAGRVAIDFGVYGAPETFLISADGIILAKHVGVMSDTVWRSTFAPKITNGASR